MINEEEQELEDFIEDRYYGEEMHVFAKDFGRYLLEFVNHLHEQDIRQATKRKHTNNCWYNGYRDEFVPGEVFHSPEAPYDYEFKWKFFGSKSAMTSYRSTWRRLRAYTRALGHLDGAERDST